MEFKMKKTLCLFFLAALSFSAFGQTVIGVKGSFGQNSYTGSDWKDYEDANGLESYDTILDTKSIGLFASIPLNKSFFIQPEIRYGNDWIDYDTDYTDDISVWEVFNAVEIPLYLKAVFGENRKGSRFYLMAGPQLRMMIGDVELDYTEVPVGDYYDNTSVMGIAGGLGYELKTKNGFWLFGFKYSRDLTSVSSKMDAFLQKTQFEIGYGGSL